jgi:hypothetical protein
MTVSTNTLTTKISVVALTCGLVGLYAGLVGEYCGLVGLYAGLVGEYCGLVGLYAGLVGEYCDDFETCKIREEHGESTIHSLPVGSLDCRRGSSANTVDLWDYTQGSLGCRPGWSVNTAGLLDCKPGWSASTVVQKNAW